MIDIVDLEIIEDHLKGYIKAYCDIYVTVDDGKNHCEEYSSGDIAQHGDLIIVRIFTKGFDIKYEGDANNSCKRQLDDISIFLANTIVNIKENL